MIYILTTFAIVHLFSLLFIVIILVVEVVFARNFVSRKERKREKRSLTWLFLQFANVKITSN